MTLKPFLEDMLSMSTGADGHTLQIHFSRPVTVDDRLALMDAHNYAVTRPAAPVDGLEVVSYEVFYAPTREWTKTTIPNYYRDNDNLVRELVTRTQAEAIIAAERANTETALDQRNMTIADLARLEADNAALTARVKELEAENTALEKQALRDRSLANETHSDATLWQFSVDMGDHPSLLVKVWRQRKALETQLAAARKALEPFAAVLNDYDPENEGDFTPGTLVIGSVTNYEITLGDLRDARAALEDKP
ncbi:hypothetical protein EDF68_10355 [Ochrobactrum sp. BH3]|nr:hypothetical protein EDF68_10355 [Ochrobactrum sp. BH3]